MSLLGKQAPLRKVIDSPHLKRILQYCRFSKYFTIQPKTGLEKDDGLTCFISVLVQSSRSGMDCF